MRRQKIEGPGRKASGQLLRAATIIMGSTCSGSWTPGSDGWRADLVSYAQGTEFRDINPNVNINRPDKNGLQDTELLLINFTG